MNGTEPLDLFVSKCRYPCKALLDFCRNHLREQKKHALWDDFGGQDPEEPGFVGRFKVSEQGRTFVITGECGDWRINPESSIK